MSSGHRSCLTAWVFACLGLLCATSCRRSPVQGARKSPASPALVSAVETADAGQRIRRDPARPRAVIWIGLDGLDWELMDRLSGEGLLPNWKRLTETGLTANLESFMPMISPVIWTTIATGVGPDIHGVLDFQEGDPKTGVKVPISGLSRRVPAIWNVASRAGKKVGVVGWWATHPAEEVNGFFISDRASPILFSGVPRAGVAFPPSLETTVGEVIRRDGAVRATDLSQFIDLPADEITGALASGQGMENRVVALSRIVVATRIYHRIARELYDRDLPDLVALYIEGTDEIAHVFAPYTEPKLECVSQTDYARYHRAIPAYYALIDRMLGQWMRRAQEDHAILIVNSDHGFKWGTDRPCDRSSSEPSTAAYWHRRQGVLAAWEQGMARSSPRGEASVLDMAPTVLALLGMPADGRMPGRPIAGFRYLEKPQRKEGLLVGDVRRVPAQAPTTAQAAEYTRKLIALGYLSGTDTTPLAPSGESAPGLTEGAWNNLGLYFRDTKKDLPAAAAAFQKALAIRPDYAAPMFNLAVAERARGRWREALDLLFRSLAAGHPAPEKTILQWAWFATGAHRPEIAISLLERGVAAYPRSEEIARELARRRFERKDCDRAAALLRAFAQSQNRDTLNLLGLSELCLGRPEAARGFFQRSLSLDPAQPSVREAIAFIDKANR